MKVWFPQNFQTYLLIGKFPHDLINQLLIERNIEASDVSVGEYKFGYKVLQSFNLEVNGLFLWVNDYCIITGE